MVKAKKQRRNSSRYALAKDVYPLLRWYAISGDPPPISEAGRYVKRKVRLLLTAAGDVTVGTLSQQLGHGGDFVILQIHAWAAMGTSGANSATFSYYPGTLLSGGLTANNALTVGDEGTFSRRSGVGVDIPKGRTICRAYDTASTQKILTSTGACTVYVSCLQFAE
jgi:hypothetical protein